VPVSRNAEIFRAESRFPRFAGMPLAPRREPRADLDG
jgi:hypothetical protein